MLAQVGVVCGIYGTALNGMLAWLHGSQLQPRDYLVNYGFLGLCYFPASTGYTSLLNGLRAKLFPYFTKFQLDNFSLMYFVSKPALFFDLFFIHCVFQGFVGLALYNVGQHFYSIKAEPADQHFESEMERVKATHENHLKNLLKIRFFLSLTSVLVDVWLPHWELRKNFREDPVEILKSRGIRSFYWSKQILVTAAWHTAILHQHLNLSN